MKTLDQEPDGAARFAYAYLGVLLALFATALVAAIAYPLIGATGLCRGDETGLCVPASTGIVGIVAFIGFGFLVAHVLLLGWEWAAWVPVVALVVAQVAVETEVIGLAWLGLLIPALAAGLTYSWPNRAPSKKARIIRLVVLGIIVIQFIAWIIGIAIMPV